MILSLNYQRVYRDYISLYTYIPISGQKVLEFGSLLNWVGNSDTLVS